MSRYQLRRDRLRRLIKKSDVDGFLVTNFTNVTYLSGFTGEDSFLLILPAGEIVLSDPRYTTQLQEECPGVDLEIRPPGTAMLASIRKVLRRAKCKAVGFESDSLTVGLYGSLVEGIDAVQWVRCQEMVERLRRIKDRDEIRSIRTAVMLAERSFQVIRCGLRAEEHERTVAHALEREIRRFGGRGCSFPPIVAIGPRSALPHARPQDIPLCGHGLLLIDWGADSADGYKSDLTRVLLTGKISPKLERIYKVVLKAQEQAIAAIRPGALMSDVDAIARNIIKDAGFGKNFGHGLGHGIGLEIHEVTRLASNQHREFKAGMVVTVEPGIYIPGWGGVRIEDDILVTRNGHDVLSSVPKDFESTFVGCN